MATKVRTLTELKARIEFRKARYYRLLSKGVPAIVLQQSKDLTAEMQLSYNKRITWLGKCMGFTNINLPQA